MNEPKARGAQVRAHILGQEYTVWERTMMGRWRDVNSGRSRDWDELIDPVDTL